MKSKNPLRRPGAAMAIPLAILLPTLGAALPASAAEHTATFETNLNGWMATEGSSSSDWARGNGTSIWRVRTPTTLARSPGSSPRVSRKRSLA
uniref:MAM domain-containing protein, meprin/A5/mu n=1 Tax=Candidatus Kentrum sp. UNK TaxID=2126344 RepID=A0A451B1J5_9GAMM|nr:MAG: hypothetical protein BECKUNK1418G_GA0071005_110214 [Candidatus Kentron sp. UNK]VFK72151.1 MAG: hypothetical protein BECKUNK1418H_GA0071006_109814 [Candidatus Kentron sp. UNK]